MELAAAVYSRKRIASLGYSFFLERRKRSALTQKNCYCSVAAARTAAYSAHMSAQVASADLLES